MYKIFDTPKDKYDIVNKDYVDNLINVINLLQEKIVELEDRISILEGASIKIESITIHGPDTIYL